MEYTGEKKIKGNNSTKYGRNDFISRKHKYVKDSEQNVVSNDRSTVTNLPILPNEPSSPKKDEDQNYGDCSEKVNATRSAGKREKEPEVEMGGQNNAADETFLPPKKRKKSRGVGDEYEANDVRSLDVEAETRIVFDTPSENWQKEKSRCFGLKVKNYHKTVPTRQVSINERPAKHRQIRGDGNCLFRTLSYIIFGVQSHYAEIRQKIWEDGIWDTDVEKRAVASMLNTNVYVYCTYGTEQTCSWNKYTPINSASKSSMYILHRNNRYEPVLDVVDCEFQYLFSRSPYLPVRKYVLEKY
ncbi:hypothetical protein CHS0354_027428 [Potamilus streckersoni]|uniref:OTU domain-containing protein n=1 Tax=Potamilus streckersoni TaxID=2493646 RepID=A0AAE0S2W2_9BIVA|nr:hypothetical protein CHS0354_027428 [Potamilus streckersoni]